MTDKQLEN